MKLFFGTFMVFALCWPVVSSGEKYQWEFAGWYGGGAFPNVVYDPNVKDRVYLVSDVAGLYRSDTGGETWRLMTKGLTNYIGATLEIAPSDSNLIFSGMKHGLFVSRNAGKYWEKVESLPRDISFVRPHNYKSITIANSDSERLCVGTAKGHIFCSKNGGQSWTKLNLREESIPEDAPIAVLHYDERSNGLWIAHEKGLSHYDFHSKKIETILERAAGVNDLVVNKLGMYVAGGDRVLSSFDGGDSWKASTPFPQGEVFRLDVSKGRQIYAAVNYGWRGRLYLSRDQGRTWEEIGLDKTGDLEGNPTRIWANRFGKVASIKMNPFNHNELFETDWWGVWKSRDGGLSMQEKIQGAPNAVGSDIHFSSNGVLYVATMDNGLLKSQDHGNRYTALFPKHGHHAEINGHVWQVVSSEAGKHIVATSSPWGKKISQVIISNDGGETFDIVRRGLPATRSKKNTMWHEGYPRALAADPTDRFRLYLGIDGDDHGGFFISQDRGKSWKLSAGQPDSRRIYNGLAVDPTDPRRIVWGANGKGGGVYITEDRGKTWAHVFKKMKWVFDVAIDAQGIIYAVGDHRGAAIYRSGDSGKTWTRLHSFPEGRAAQAFAIDPNNPARLALSAVHWGGDGPGAMYYSQDYGKHWVDVTGDLPVGSGASSATFDPTGKFLFVNLYAASIWKLDLSPFMMNSPS